MVTFEPTQPLATPTRSGQFAERRLGLGRRIRAIADLSITRQDWGGYWIFAGTPVAIAVLASTVFARTLDSMGWNGLSSFVTSVAPYIGSWALAFLSMVLMMRPLGANWAQTVPRLHVPLVVLHAGLCSLVVAAWTVAAGLLGEDMLWFASLTSALTAALVVVAVVMNRYLRSEQWFILVFLAMHVGGGFVASQRRPESFPAGPFDESALVSLASTSDTFLGGASRGTFAAGCVIVSIVLWGVVYTIVRRLTRARAERSLLRAPAFPGTDGQRSLVDGRLGGVTEWGLGNPANAIRDGTSLASSDTRSPVDRVAAVMRTLAKPSLFERAAFLLVVALSLFFAAADSGLRHTNSIEGVSAPQLASVFLLLVVAASTPVATLRMWQVRRPHLRRESLWPVPSEVFRAGILKAVERGLLRPLGVVAVVVGVQAILAGTSPLWPLVTVIAIAAIHLWHGVRQLSLRPSEPESLLSAVLTAAAAAIAGLIVLVDVVAPGSVLGMQSVEGSADAVAAAELLSRACQLFLVGLAVASFLRWRQARRRWLAGGAATGAPAEDCPRDESSIGAKSND